MALFVSLTEDDSTYDLVTLLNRLNGVKSKVPAKKAKKQAEEEGDEEEEVDEELEAAKASPLGKLVTNNQRQKLLDDGFFPTVNKLLKSSEADIEVAFSLVFAILADQGASAEANVKKIVAILTKDTKKHTALNLKLLTILYSLSQTTTHGRPGSLTIFSTILEYALATNNSSMLKGNLNPTTIVAWELKGDEAAKVYQLCHRITSANEEDSSAHEFAYLFLSASDKSAASKVVEHVTGAVVYAVQALNLTRLDQLAHLPVVQAQKGTKQGGVVFDLLTVFTSGSISDFLKFAKSNGKFCKANGLDQDKLAADMRTLTLCTLGSNKEVLSYDELFEALSIKDEDELEELLIQTVASGKFDASIDQEKSQVIVRRSVERQFSDDKWDSIADKLDMWRATVVNTLNALSDRQN
jgi:hypothetical protein